MPGQEGAMKITRKDFLRVSRLRPSGGGRGKSRTRHLRRGRGPRRRDQAKRWGMVIDLQKCRQDAGCTECIQACDKAHNIPQIPDPAHEVKWIWKEPFENVFPQAQTDYTRQEYAGHPIPMLCNHCEDPPCMRVCPTQATWKRAKTAS